MKQNIGESQRKLHKNYAYNLFYQIVTYTVPLITTPYLSRVLGPAGIGEVSFAESIVSYFVLFCNMGINTYALREISYKQDDLKARSIVFWETKILSVTTCLCSLFLYSGVIYHFENKIIYLVLSINIVAAFADITWFFRGLEEFGKIVIRNTIIKVLTVAYIFIFVKNEGDLIYYLVGITFIQFIGNISLWLYLPLYIRKVPIVELRPVRIIPVAFSLFVPEIAVTVYTVLDKTMIGIISKDYYQNGYYEQAMKITKMIMALVTSLGTVIAPRVGAFYGKGDIEGAKELIYKNYQFVFGLGVPLALGLYYIAPAFVIWFLGEKFIQTGILLRILTWLIVVIGLSNVTGMQYLVPAKKQNILTITVVIGATVNLILNIVLIRLYGSNGAAIASLIAEVVVLFVQFAFVHNEISLIRIFKDGIPFIVSGIFMLMCLETLGYFIQGTHVELIFSVIFGAILYFIMVIFILKMGYRK